MVLHDASSSGAQIGLGQWRENKCLSFKFEGISLGCDSTDTACVFDVVGLQWNDVEDVVQGNATIEVAACPKPSGCILEFHALDPAVSSAFTNLTAINITLVNPGVPRSWWADDLQIAWVNNDCTVAACRARVPNEMASPRAHGSFAGSAKGLMRWAIRG
ncbi:hypothetical protein N657DRAFT_650724 [Parathielavia appendiculata]|uniref:DUF7371 domain-containing protein n=1 Tax=Parathielavia appendiculata TaxID=2587402 RepID=A0AAN6TQT1_9PEZI|nr:hypothetical protein N657DRAFT_650724 [Parathielavia appendiculata]